MAENEFKVGDIVTLKSTGPTMTVEAVSTDDGNCRCVWFVNNEARRDSFPMGTLVAVVR